VKANATGTGHKKMAEKRKYLTVGGNSPNIGEEAEAAVIAQLEKLPFGELGYIEVPFGNKREALFSKYEFGGADHWQFCFIRFDGTIPEDRTIRSYMPQALAALRAVIALGDDRKAKRMKNEISTALEAEMQKRQLTIF